MSEAACINYCAALCDQLYQAPNAEERLQAQKILEYQFPTFSDEGGGGIAMASVPAPAGFQQQLAFPIASPTDTASTLRLLLENSPSPYVQTFCFARLKQLVLAQFAVFTDDTKEQLRTFLLEYAFMHPDLMPFIITHLASLLAQLTLLGWVDLDSYQNIYNDILQFVQATMDHRIVGMQILAVIIQDMNPPSFTRSSTRFRKAASGFKEKQLLDIFQLAYTTLTEINQGTLAFTNEYQAERLKDATLNVLWRSLSFDFSGAAVDESTEEIGTIQIPASWRSVIEDEGFVPAFFQAYRSSRPPTSARAMDCLVAIASIRRALFTVPTQRNAFVLAITAGIQDIILTSQGMDDSDNYNSFCRLLYRFRIAAPLNEMVTKPGYLEWMGLVAQFSLKGFQSWKWSANTITYILGFWSRIVQSVTYYQLPEEATNKLDEISNELVRVYVSTAMDAVPIRLEEGLDDPLDNEDELSDTLSMLGQIARRRYQPSTAALLAAFEPTLAQYQELIQSSGNITAPDAFRAALEVLETKFAWLVYMTAAFIGCRQAYLNCDQSEPIDAELTAKVVQLMQAQQTLHANHGGVFMNQSLDLAFIYFFFQFKKAYMSDASDNMEIYNVLSERIGVTKQSEMLNVVMQRVMNNLQYWGDNVRMITKTLNLFEDLTAGFMGIRTLLKADTTQHIMQNHMSNSFAFFSNPKQLENRSLFYRIMCKLLFGEDNVTASSFFDFMQPFDLKIAQLGPLNTEDDFRQDNVKRVLQGIFFDLNGFLQPIITRRCFDFFYDWFWPDYANLLMRAMDAWAPDPVCNCLLIFYTEFLTNRSQRLTFDSSSVNGILMFRQASEIICRYGSKSLELQVQDESQKYDHKYKGVAMLFNILARTISGRYVNFGVFWLYQDKAIDNAFSIILRLMMAIPLQDLAAFPKLRNSYYNVLDEWSRDQLMALPTPPAPEVFLYLMESCEQGLETLDAGVRAHVCAIIFNFGMFLANQTHKMQTNPSQRRRRSSAANSLIDPANDTPEHWLVVYFKQYPSILPTLMSTLFYLALFENTQEQWSICRPLYVLIYLRRDYAMKYTNAVAEVQLPEKRDFISEKLKSILSEVQFTLTSRDRDNFTQCVTGFVREMKLENVTPVPLLNPPPM
ncbi:armadillo-type protein [Gongronella butleri]|nr:armadillo-type protein [Gongronella butleri]